MIGWVQAVLAEHVLAPQGDESIPEDRRTHLDPESSPVDAEPQELDVRPATSRITDQEIGGGGEGWQHTITVAVDVTHGDVVEAGRRRDLIVTDLVDRMFAVRDTLAQLANPDDPGESITRVEVGLIDYVPLGTGDTNESAVVPFVVDTYRDR